MKKKINKKNFNDVLDNIKQQFAEADNDRKQIWVESMNEFLDSMRDDDFFGTEGQLDPRGDNRD